MSKFSKILVCGDSFSVQDYKLMKYEKISVFDKEKAEYNKTKQYVCWPDLVAKHYDVKVINLSECGFSTDEILFRITDRLGEDQDFDLVIAALSPWYRSHLPFLDHNVKLKLTPPENTELRRMVFKSLRPYDLDEIPYFVQKFYRNLFYLECICNRFNIPLIACQMIAPYDASSFKEKNINVIRINFNSSIVKNSLSYLIEGKNFIGWPFIDDLGGFVIDQKYLSHVHSNCDDRIGKMYKASSRKVKEVFDSHPNQKGHKKLANVFIRKIDETKIFDSSR